MGLALIGVVIFVALSIALDNYVGIPFDTSYRIACASGCLLYIIKLGLDHPGEKWPWVGFSIALLLSISLFFTPLLDRPASRGEIVLFALPDAIILLGARIATYPVNNDDDRRIIHQRLILALVIALAFFGVLVAVSLNARS